MTEKQIIETAKHFKFHPDTCKCINSKKFMICHNGPYTKFWIWKRERSTFFITKEKPCSTKKIKKFDVLGHRGEFIGVISD